MMFNINQGYRNSNETITVEMDHSLISEIDKRISNSTRFLKAKRKFHLPQNISKEVHGYVLNGYDHIIQYQADFSVKVNIEYRTHFYT